MHLLCALSVLCVQFAANTLEKGHGTQRAEDLPSESWWPGWLFWQARRPDVVRARFAKSIAASTLLKSRSRMWSCFTLDTTRADHLPAYGYSCSHTKPRFAGQTGCRLRSVRLGCSPHASLALFDHDRPVSDLHRRADHGNNALAAVHLTMAEAFAADGYKTGAFVGAFVPNGRWGLNQGFDHMMTVRPEKIQEAGSGTCAEARQRSRRCCARVA